MDETADQVRDAKIATLEQQVSLLQRQHETMLGEIHDLKSAVYQGEGLVLWRSMASEGSSVVANTCAEFARKRVSGGA